MAEGSLPRSDQAAWTWAILSAVAVLIAIGIISGPALEPRLGPAERLPVGDPSPGPVVTP
jgi:hypothetical protein